MDSAVIQPDQPTDQYSTERFVSFRMHLGVAGAIRAASSPDIQAATDTELAAFWTSVARYAITRETSGRDS